MILIRQLAMFFSVTSYARLIGALFMFLPAIVLNGAPTMENEVLSLQEPFIELASPIVRSVANETWVERPYYRDDDLAARKTQDHEPESSSYGPINPGFSFPLEGSAMDEVDQYLWAVYERSPTKQDSTGDFTWKDAAAALRLGMSVKTYVIGGMDPDLRELLYHAGLAIDAAGIHWPILSAFRDDYRQSLASGFKAHTNNSLHGGSVATGGYERGCAVDIMDVNGNSGTLWQWLDTNSARIGLQRLLPRADPAHVQPRGAWHDLAVALRNYRLRARTIAGETATVKTNRDSACVNLRHWEAQTKSPISRFVKVEPTAQKHTLAEKFSRTREAVTLSAPGAAATRPFRTAKLPAY
jgi:hypothetical protein